MTEYFSSTGPATDARGSYGAFDDVLEIEAAPGVMVRAVTGDRLMVSHVTIAPNSEAAVHSHHEEQFGVVIAGSCEFELGGVTRSLKPGDTYHAPPGVPHGARTSSETCTILDMFVPPRRALLDLIEASRPGAEPQG